MEGDGKSFMELKELKPAIARHLLAECDGVRYTVNAGIIRVKENKWQYYAELKDLKANSVTIAEIEKVRLIDSGENGDKENCS